MKSFLAKAKELRESAEKFIQEAVEKDGIGAPKWIEVEWSDPEDQESSPLLVVGKFTYEDEPATIAVSHIERELVRGVCTDEYGYGSQLTFRFRELTTDSLCEIADYLGAK